MTSGNPLFLRNFPPFKFYSFVLQRLGQQPLYLIEGDSQQPTQTYLMKYFHLITLAALMMMTSCYQDRDDSEVIITTPVPVPKTDTDIEGGLIDPENGTAEENYSVVINGADHTVDNDQFLIEDVRVKKQGQFLEAFRGDRLIGLGFHHLIEFDLNKVELVSINEIERDLDKVGDSFVVDIGIVKVTFDGSAFDVIDPKIEASIMERSIAQKALGSTAYVFDSDGDSQLLSTVPAYGFTLRDINNQYISGNNIQLEFDAVETGQFLLHYSEDNQQWEQLSILSESIIVNELGYYMVAETMNGVYQEGIVLNEGRPISFLRSRIDHLDDYQFFTTELGRWGAVIPEMDNVTLDFLSPCDDQISTVSINGQENGVEDIISELDASQEYIFQLSTKVIDCNGEIGQTSGVVLNTDQEETLIFSGDITDLQVAVCENDFEVATYSFEDSSTGPALDWNTSLDDDLEYLIACDQYENGVAIIQIRDDMMIYEAVEVVAESGRTQLITQDENFWISFRGTTSDMYDNEEVNVFLDEISFGDDGYLITCETSQQGCGITDFSVTHYEVDQGFIRLSFSGEVWMQTILNPKAGYFPVRGIIETRI